MAYASRRADDGGPVRELRPGDIVTFAPGERHWHGATPDRPMVYLAGTAAEWSEHVTGEEYER